MREGEWGERGGVRERGSERLGEKDVKMQVWEQLENGNRDRWWEEKRGSERKRERGRERGEDGNMSDIKRFAMPLGPDYIAIMESHCFVSEYANVPA